MGAHCEHRHFVQTPMVVGGRVSEQEDDPLSEAQ